ncbi:MAG: GNAT family N-acetyltransferase [Gammaproteobacteria bacterium AqS3]|nr:GNAT family N-acetyltransferase [Gammaproteobacteria bacterium AqS3]
MTVTIRYAQPEDQQRCSELLGVLAEHTGGPFESFDSEAFEYLLTNERGCLIVAEEDGNILGLASISFNFALRYNGEYCTLEELVLDQDARGKNVGGRLVEETIRLAKERGCKEYGLYILESTLQNQTFYEKFGFAKVGIDMRQKL